MKTLESELCCISQIHSHFPWMHSSQVFSIPQNHAFIFTLSHLQRFFTFLQAFTVFHCFPDTIQKFFQRRLSSICTNFNLPWGFHKGSSTFLKIVKIFKPFSTKNKSFFCQRLFKQFLPHLLMAKLFKFAKVPFAMTLPEKTLNFPGDNIHRKFRPKTSHDFCPNVHVKAL